MSIRRVTTLFTVTVALIAVVIGGLAYGMKLVLDDFAAAVQQKETAGALAREMRQSSDDLTKYARLYAQTKSARFKDIYNAIVDIRAGKIDRPQDYSATYWAKPPQDVKAALAKTGQKIALIELMKQNGFTDRELNLLAEANKKSNVLAEREAIAFAAIEGKGAGASLPMQPGETPEAYANRILSDATYISAKTEIADKLNEFDQVLHERTEKDYETERDRVRFVLALFAASIIVLIGAILLLARYMMTGIVAPLNVLTAAFRKTNGRFSVSRIEIAADNDLKWLGGNINEFLGQVRGFLHSVGATATNLASSSEELTATADDAATAGEKIAHTIEETSEEAATQESSMHAVDATIGEIAGSIGEIRSGVESIVTSSSEIREAATVGQQTVEEATHKIESLETTITQAADVMQALGKRSDEIGNIVEQISAIAQQTNLLALNAAIEAARAGEHGRGFAVVAEEVRKLAEQSSHSADDIAARISLIQSDTEKAVQAVNDGEKEVTSSAAAVVSVSQAFGNIDTRVQGMAEHIGQSAKAVEMVAASSDAVRHEVDGVADSSSVMTEAMKASADIAQRQKDGLKAMEEASRALALEAQELQNELAKFSV